MQGHTTVQGLSPRCGHTGAALRASPLDQIVVGTDAGGCRALLHELRRHGGRPARIVLPVFRQTVRIPQRKRCGLRQIAPARQTRARSLALCLWPAAGGCHPGTERLPGAGPVAQLWIGEPDCGNAGRATPVAPPPCPWRALGTHYSGPYRGGPGARTSMPSPTAGTRVSASLAPLVPPSVSPPLAWTSLVPRRSSTA